MRAGADLDAWFGGGERVRLTAGNSGSAELFCQVAGSGPWLTLVHGFPMCSWDWAGVADLLSANHRLLMPDLLGYGDSDKPPGHQYTLVEQADWLEAVWRHYGIDETHLVASDIGGSVVQELLARERAGLLHVRIGRSVLLNGALYQSRARPRLMQRLLATPGIGDVAVRLINKRNFTRTLAAAFSAAHPLPADTADAYWFALRRRSPSVHVHRLLSYIPERAQHQARWEGALEHSTIPLAFVWGMSDPVSGAPMADHLRQRLPSAEVVALDDVGHYPHVEVPGQVGRALNRLLGSPDSA